MTAKKKAMAVHSGDKAPVTVEGMLARAIERGIDADGLEKLVSLRERVMEIEARQAFNQAMQAFQSECPPITKNKKVSTGRYEYSYAELDHIAETLRPLLQKRGLSYRFDSEIDAEGTIKVACIVRHVDGHQEVTHFSAPIDPEARMNNAQKAASALSYARRYALILAFGLTTGELDDDGMRAGTQTITDEQEATITALMEEVGADTKAFLKFLKVNAVSDIPEGRYDYAVKALEQKRRQQK